VKLFCEIKVHKELESPIIFDMIISLGSHICSLGMNHLKCLNIVRI
jgi:hypothetical protein